MTLGSKLPAFSASRQLTMRRQKADTRWHRVYILQRWAAAAAQG